MKSTEEMGLLLVCVADPIYRYKEDTSLMFVGIN